MKERDFFGGRSLLIKSGGSREEGGLEPSQLSVIADSAEVEVLIMDRTQMQFFPDSIQKQITRQIENEKCIEKPFSDEQFAAEIRKFDNWDAVRRAKFLDTIEDNFHLKVGLQHQPRIL